MYDSFAEQVLHILGFMIATYCQREEQSKLITLYPFIIYNGNNKLKWKLFTSQSLKHFIQNKSIPIFIKTFNVNENDDICNNNSSEENKEEHKNENDTMSDNENDENHQFPIYTPLSLTAFNIKGINTTDINDIYNESDIKNIIKSYNFESYKSFVIMLIIEQFYKHKFPEKIGKNTSMHFLDRNIVNTPMIDIIFNKQELKERILTKFKEYDHFDKEEKGAVLNIYQHKNEKFDFMLRIIKEINNKYDLKWFKKQLRNIKHHNYEDHNDSFFNDIAHRFEFAKNNGKDNLDQFCEMLNILFLSKMKLFNQWVIIHSEEAFLSEISSKSFMTMDIDIIAITKNFEKVVMIQGLLKKVSLTFDSCVLL